MKTTRFHKKLLVERVQTGVRMEKRLIKVLKALAEFHDLTLGDLLEGIVLHAFDGKAPFQEPSRKRIRQLKKFYGLDLDARASHRLTEVRSAGRRRKAETNRKPRAPRKRRTYARVYSKAAGVRKSARSTRGRKILKGGRAR